MEVMEEVVVEKDEVVGCGYGWSWRRQRAMATVNYIQSSGNIFPQSHPILNESAFNKSILLFPYHFTNNFLQYKNFVPRFYSNIQ